ncbi:molybdenum cofactor guanylyltransferase [Pseudalkalibacillus caeni]|uniref:Probable molybdenum cofactor guanylyltransferase n=1 Tax=Exobacillus caeni TaxID=2574798 RepID=A0A5R9F745_9BACL|nr:molybdenum cofactor guanylyltransferase [Pseudalkalibacillus caeni]TLS36314.1 molybdenum cofactor guanylyltransferase [Pseudalkalibacillus caeni]
MNGKVTGILLAGGKSSRFGKPKAFAKLNNEPFYKRALRALHACCDGIVIVTKEDLIDHFDLEGVPLITDDDRFKGQGPLAGIYSVMKEYDSHIYVVVPCDTPFVDANVTTELVKYALSVPHAAAVVPEIEGRKHPLVAVYKRGCIPVLERLLKEKNNKVRALLDKVQTVYVTENDINVSPQCFININSQEEYRTYIDGKEMENDGE